MSTAHAISAKLTLRTLTCGGCAVVFAIPEEMYYRYDNHGRAVRCPNPDCSWRYMVRVEPRVKKLEDELERAKKARRWAEQRTEQANRSAAAYKGHLTRTKKRVAAGVCPCCKRSFADLRDHMATKHPDYADDGETP